MRNLKKEEVFDFTNKVELLLKSLDGTEIVGSEYKLKQINKIKDELEKDLYKFIPTPKELYSMKAQVAYNQMIKAKNTYKKLKDNNGVPDELKEAYTTYQLRLNEYTDAKKIRDEFNKLV